MKLFYFSIALILSYSSFCQSSYSQVTVFKNAGLSSRPLFSSEAKSIEFNLIQRITGGSDTSISVAVSVENVGEEKVGRSTGVIVNANLDVSFAGSTVSQVYRNEGYMELSKEEFHEVFTFINTSMGKANPMQELQTAFNLALSDKFGISLIYDGSEWSYLFRLDDAQYQVEFQDSIDIIVKLKEMDELFQSSF
jgi:hypothetical protein